MWGHNLHLGCWQSCVPMMRSLKSTYNTPYSNKACLKLAEILRNHLISILYRKQIIITNKITKLKNKIQDALVLFQITSVAMNHYEKRLDKFMNRKRDELYRLERSYHPCNTEQSGRNCFNNSFNVINLSDHRLSEPEKSVLSKGLSFCLTKPIDPIQFCGDVETFFRQLRLKESFSESASPSSAPTASSNTCTNTSSPHTTTSHTPTISRQACTPTPIHTTTSSADNCLPSSGILNQSTSTSLPTNSVVTTTETTSTPTTLSSPLPHANLQLNQNTTIPTAIDSLTTLSCVPEPTNHGNTVFPNQTIPYMQHDGKIAIKSKRKYSTWTPPEGRKYNLNLYIECFRKRVQSEILKYRLYTTPCNNLSASEKRAIRLT